MARIFTDGGAGVIQSANQTLLDLDSFSIAFWMFRTGTPAAERGILSADDGNVDSGWFLSLTTGNLIRAARVFSTATMSRLSSTAPALNTWVHVVIANNMTGTGTANTDFTFYFNGKSEAGTAGATGSGSHVREAVPFKIGSSGGGLAAPVQIGGPLGVWGRALSPAEALALATGAHPSRFKEGLIDNFDMMSALHEEGWLAKMLLIAGATNPTNAAVNPPSEYFSRASFEMRLNVRPMLKSKARYIVVSGGSTFNDSVTESLSASDSETAQAAFVSARIESGTAADSETAAATFVSARTEALTAADSETGAQASPVSRADALTAADSIAGPAIFAIARAESLTVADSEDATTSTGPQVYNVAAIDSLSASDSQTGAVTYPVTRTESGAVADSAASAAFFAGLRAELLATSESIGAASSLFANRIDALSVQDSETGVLAPTSATFTFRIEGGSVVTLSLIAGPMLSSSVSAGPVLTSSVSGGPA